MNFLSLVFMVVAAVGAVTATDYCASSLCGSSKHIACGNSGAYANTCPKDVAMIAMDASMKSAIVNAHNSRRNFVASGSDPNHDAACRMATMQWDDELATLAALNVKQCAMKHDACHNTDAFKYSGQNLAWMGYFEPLNSQKQAESAVEMWYSEIKNSKMQYMNSYPSNYQGPTIGHFTVQNTRVGCAASIYSEPNAPYKVYLMACNYATTNMISFPIYKGCSKAATGCSTGSNPIYSNLCSTSEYYDVNKWF